MPQAGHLSELVASFIFADNLIADAHVPDASGQFLKSRDIRSFVTEAAVLKIFIGWERFLEQSFIEYLMGASGTAGASLHRYANPYSKDHANRLLIGTQRYVDWGNPEIVIKMANLYFDNGVPYDGALSSIRADLLDLRAIRNAAAHLSTSTSQQLDQLVLRKLGRASVGSTVYDLVTAIDPQTPGKTVLQSFTNRLQAAATIISRGQ